MKNALQLMLMVLIAAMITSCVGSPPKADETSENLQKQEKKEMTADLENGKAVYDRICMACHMTGVAGAAKMTNTERWAEVAPKGLKALQESVINGIPDGKYGVMPERGSCTDCTDKDLYDAVAYMLDEAGVLDKAKK